MKELFLFITLLALAPAACNRSTNQTPSPPPPTAGPTAEPSRGPLELSAIELHKVKLTHPQKLREKEGQEKVYDQAWLVMLFFKNLGPVSNTGMDLFIGDYRIPEYGGFNEGIYFRIYEERQLRSLNGGEVSVSFAGMKMHSLGRKFSTENYEKLSLEEESKLLKR
jgi:hypothetical protein